MIKLIILDIDGVILGGLRGINFPYPSQKVTTYLMDLQNQGVKISLCTGKPSFSVQSIIEKVNLDNMHISDGGAVIFDPLSKNVYKAMTVPQKTITKIFKETSTHFALWELYTFKTKHVQAGVYPKEIHEDPVMMPCIEEPDLLKVVEQNELNKVELKCLPADESYFDQVISKYADQLTVQWTYSPMVPLYKIGIITAKGVDKRSSVQDLIKYYQILPQDVLAVGDTLMDWNFMEGCGYLATLANAKSEMQDLVQKKGGFIGGHVDNDGIIDILEHFKEYIEKN